MYGLVAVALAMHTHKHICSCTHACEWCSWLGLSCWMPVIGPQQRAWLPQPPLAVSPPIKSFFGLSAELSGKTETQQPPIFIHSKPAF